MLYVCADYLRQHWAGRNTTPVILCADDDVTSRVKSSYDLTFTIKEYVQGESYHVLFIPAYFSPFLYF